MQHARLLCPPISPNVCSNSCSLSWCCYPLLFSPCIFPSIRVSFSESAVPVMWTKDYGFSFSISPSNEYSKLISFRIDWFDLLAVQGTLKSLLQHHRLKASILWHSTFFMIQLSHPSHVPSHISLHSISFFVLLIFDSYSLHTSTIQSKYSSNCLSTLKFSSSYCCYATREATPNERPRAQLLEGSPRSLELEQSLKQQRRPSTDKNKESKF